MRYRVKYRDTELLKRYLGLGSLELDPIEAHTVK